MKLTKELLKRFFELYKELWTTERKVYNEDLIDWWFVVFWEVRDKFWKIYEMFDGDTEYPILERLITITDDMCVYNTDLLSNEDLERFKCSFSTWNISVNEDWVIYDKDTTDIHYSIMMNAQFYKECAYCRIDFKTTDEAIDYIFKEMKLW